MKTKLRMILPALAAVALASGCSKNEEPATSEASKAANSTIADAANAAAKTSEALKQTAEKTQADVQKAAEQAQAIGTTATEKIQALIDSAKKLMGEDKWTEALNILQQLANSKLTPEQQQLVDDLKKQVQQHLTQGAAEKTLDALQKK